MMVGDEWVDAMQRDDNKHAMSTKTNYWMKILHLRLNQTSHG